MTAIKIVADSARAPAFTSPPAFPDYNTLVDDRNNGRYDLVINKTHQQIGNTPWTYYNYLFRLPIQESQTTVNFERYTNVKAWKLTQQLDKTPASNLAGMQKITSQLQTMFLKDLPVIPLWLQRRLGTVEHEPMDELALVQGHEPPEHAGVLARLLPDGRHQGAVPAEGALGVHVRAELSIVSSPGLRAGGETAA